MRAVVITNSEVGEDGNSKLFRVHERSLRARLGLEVVRREGVPVEGIADALAGAEVAFIGVWWRTPATALEAALREARERSPGTRIIFMESHDQTSSPYMGVLPLVDVFAKSQLLLDRRWYTEDLAGGYAFTDFLSRTEQLWPRGDRYGEPAPAQHLGRLEVGWNFGAARTYERLSRLGRLARVPWKMRGIDVHARLGVGQGDTWYSRYRKRGLDLLEPLARDYRVCSGGLVPRRAYWAELFRSKLVFSPFGWGEVCYRDFEAVCAGCLLVKPSMSHLRTSPDVYEAFETYIPVRWDLSDLERRCRAYLEQPEEARRIAREAQRRLAAYYRERGFPWDLSRVLLRLEVPGAPEQGPVAAIPWCEPAPMPQVGLVQP